MQQIDDSQIKTVLCSLNTVALYLHFGDRGRDIGGRAVVFQ